MSLLDGFLRDALLQGIVDSDVYIAVRDDNPPSGGAGTFDDPFDGSTQVKFDGVMNDSQKVPTGKTVRLSPGTFETKGYPTSGGWTARSGRLLGSGMGVTKLKLVNPAAGANHAIGSGSTLTGFEVSDLTIDCGFTAGQAGDTQLWRDQCFGQTRLLAAHLGNQFRSQGLRRRLCRHLCCGDNTENCVIEECVVEAPASGSSNINATFFAFGGSSTNPHTFCVVRNCVGTGRDSLALNVNANCRAIVPGVGIGTVIEGNQVINCLRGGSSENAPFKDLVVWNNYFRNVREGYWSSNVAAGRLVAIDNFIELSIEAQTRSGIKLIGASGQTLAQTVLRKNLIRYVEDPTPPPGTFRGIELDYCTSVVAENNVINNTAAVDALRYTSNCTNTKFFNNQNQAGQLLRAYNTSSSKYNYGELEDQVQDVLLPI